MYFIVPGLIFKCLLHSVLLFVYGVEQQSTFILLYVVLQFSKYLLLNRLYFLHCMFLAPLSKISCPYMCGFISELSVLFHWSVSGLLPYHNHSKSIVLITVCSWYCFCYEFGHMFNDIYPPL